MRYSEIWPRYAKFWDAAIIDKARVAQFTSEAQFAIAHKQTYEAVEAVTFVPWPMIATLHRRESDCDFTTYLGNGQPLDKRTTITPANRGPFDGPDAFGNGAVDAIHQEGWSNISDWRLEKILYYSMLFNGPGYELRDLPSPYIWGGTNIQKPGKFIADHEFNPNVMDVQPGCAPLLFMIARLDPSVTFQRET